MTWFEQWQQFAALVYGPVLIVGLMFFVVACFIVAMWIAVTLVWRDIARR